MDKETAKKAPAKQGTQKNAKSAETKTGTTAKKTQPAKSAQTTQPVQETQSVQATQPVQTTQPAQSSSRTVNTNGGNTKKSDNPWNVHIPFNIIAVVIALIAGFSILFAPILSIDLGKAGDGMKTVVSDMLGSDSSDDSSSSSGGDMFTNMIGAVFDSFEGQKISINAVQLLGISMAENPQEELFSVMLSGIDEATVLAPVVQTVVQEALASSDLSAEEKEALDKIDYEGVVRDLLAVQEDNIDEKADSIVNTIATGLEGTTLAMDDETKASLKTTIKEFCQNALNEDGELDLATWIANLASGDSNTAESTATGVVLTATSSATGNTTGSEEDSFATMQGVMKGIALVFIGIACVWFLLAVLAFVHIFTRKKKFVSWYVKLVGGFPAIIWILITVMKSVFTSMLSSNEAFASLGADGITKIVDSIGSGMWICGLCYIAIWVLGFVMIPFHKKLKQTDLAQQ